MTHMAGWNFKRRYGWTAGSGRGFSLIELLIVIALTGILAGVAVAIAPGVLKSVKGEGASTHVSTFLMRARDLAVSKRRNIQITFEAPDHLVATVRPIPGVANPGGTDSPR